MDLCTGSRGRDLSNLGWITGISAFEEIEENDKARLARTKSWTHSELGSKTRVELL